MFLPIICIKLILFVSYVRLFNVVFATFVGVLSPFSPRDDRLSVHLTCHVILNLIRMTQNTCLNKVITIRRMISFWKSCKLKVQKLLRLRKIRFKLKLPGGV